MAAKIGLFGIDIHTEYTRRQERCPVCGTRIPADVPPERACRACGCRPSA